MSDEEERMKKKRSNIQRKQELEHVKRDIIEKKLQKEERELEKDAVYGKVIQEQKNK